MSGYAKLDLSSANFTGSYLNEQRGTHPGANLDRFGSFHESSNGRSFSIGTSTPKGNVGDMLPLSQSLMLESIPLGDQKFSRSGELRRALGFSFGCISEDSSFGHSHSRPAQSLAIDELKRFRGSIQDGMNKARIRVKRLEEAMNKLVTVISSRKQQMPERSNGSNLLKMGTQSYRNSPDPMTQKVDDKGKSFQSKRSRTPVVDMRVEGRVSGILRQHMILGKDKGMVKEGSLSPDSTEEKMHRLPAGGESWDKKIKRKRSVTNVFPRPVDGDVELKRAMHGRLSNGSGPPSPDSHVFRSGSFNGDGDNINPESTSFASGSNVRPSPKNDVVKSSLSMELSGMNKDRIFQKSNNRHLVNPSLVTKGKVSRVSRPGIPTASSGSPNLPHMSGVQEEWEQPLNVNKIQPMGGVNNKKRALPSESSSPPMAQWAGQRPHKISRIKRANIMSPTSNDVEALVSSSERCVSSDYITKTSDGMNALFPLTTTKNNTEQLKDKNENNSSPPRLSESEKNGAVENKLKEKAICSVEAEERVVKGIQLVASPGLLSKNKFLVKEEVGDGVRRQGRSGRGSSFSRGRMSLAGDKLDSSPAAKPIRSMKPTSDKNGSKSGRPPLKKHSERKGFTRLALVPNDNSPDCTVEAEEDHENLLAAAELACDTSYKACSSSFWKKMEPLFTVRVEDKSYSLQQKDVSTNEMHQLQLISCQGEICVSHGLETEDLANKVQDSDLLHRRDLEEGNKNITPLYQRVLSALVMEDELEELEQSNCEGNPFLSHRDSACLQEGNIFCNGDITYSRVTNIQVSSHDFLCEGNYGFMHSEVGVLPTAFKSSLNGSLTPEINIASNSSSEGHYELMSVDERLTSELQSIGVYLETVPELAEGENEVLSRDIIQLEKRHHQLADKKKPCLDTTQKAVEKEKEFEERALEQVAMYRLTELAYKKLLATRGNTAARLGISKVPRPAALAFVKRTLARCRKFEETGKSCFSEPALRDAMLAGQPSWNNLANINAGMTDHSIQPEAKLQGPYSSGAELLGFNNGKAERVLFESNGPTVNKGKKKEVLLDDVGNGTALRSSAPVRNTIVSGTKGKRSERGKDLASRNSVGKFGRPSITTLHGDEKAKSKPKQKTAQLSTHPVGPFARGSGGMGANSNSRKGDGNILDSSKKVNDPVDVTNLPLLELDSTELGVDNDINGHQDLSSWLNFDEDNLLDHDSMGLEIPMDDLAELSMLL